jgi:alpha-mannosidase
MQLAEEWSQRIEIWIEELKQHFYRKLGDITFVGAFTKDYLTYEEAIEREFRPMPPGTPWGGKWEYGWFRTEFALPQAAEGKRIFLRPEVGGEMIIWVNGKIVGSRDLKHQGITLTRKGQAGDRYLIVTESYAGHGPQLEHGGPCPPGRIPVPEPPESQVCVSSSDYGIWNEDAYQLYLDAYTLDRLSKVLDPRSLRGMKVREALERFTEIVDFELPAEESQATFSQAREVLRPLLACTNGSTAPVFTIFGQSHLDLAWKWPWQETKRKCARTIASQLALTEEYENYRFLLCEPPIMENLKQNYPELYSRLKEKVKSGQLLPEGGVYVETDTNLPSGESLIRQCIFGKQWFKDELNYDTRMVWLPDCFGFSAQLPQIFKGCGMRYFATQKLSRALRGGDIFPYNIFMWEGIDGTRILTHFYKKNNARFDPEQLQVRWCEDRVQQNRIDTFLFPFGYGDGGGGPTREMVEIAERCHDLEGVPRTKMESPIVFFERIEQAALPYEVYVGELYLAWHRGAYTSQARTKRGNRKAEISLREAELWTGLCTWKTEQADRKQWQQKLHLLWEKLLFNQFHDILPGTSITRVHEEAVQDFNTIVAEATKLRESCQKKLVPNNRKETITIFNSLSWQRSDCIALPNGYVDALDQEGKPMICQSVQDKVFTWVTVPSCGYTSIQLQKTKLSGDEGERKSAVVVYQVAKTVIMENQYLKLAIEQNGKITSIFDQESGIEFADGLGNEFRMYKDVNIDYDAWELSSFYQDLPVKLADAASIEIVADGPVLGVVRVQHMLHHSLMVQDIVMRRNSRRVDFRTSVDWRETHKLLKVVFPVQVYAAESIQEIQFGYVKRPTHHSRRYDADRYEVCNHQYSALTEPGRTFAVLNDCKYGVSTNKNQIELTLLKAPVIPDMYADKGKQEFTYSFYAIGTGFADSDLVREGYQLNVPLTVVDGGNGLKSFISISASTIILETVKLAEDGSGDLILRLYEAIGSHTSCRIQMKLDIDQILETTMLEKMEDDVQVIGSEKIDGMTKANLTFRPFEIKTLRLRKERG